MLGSHEVCSRGYLNQCYVQATDTHMSLCKRLQDRKRAYVALLVSALDELNLIRSGKGKVSVTILLFWMKRSCKCGLRWKICISFMGMCCNSNLFPFHYSYQIIDPHDEGGGG